MFCFVSRQHDVQHHGERKEDVVASWAACMDVVVAVLFTKCWVKEFDCVFFFSSRDPWCKCGDPICQFLLSLDLSAM
jgi:hypothetical protein